MLFGVSKKVKRKKVMISNLIVINNQVVFESDDAISNVYLENGTKRDKLNLFFDDNSQKYMLDLSDLSEIVDRVGKFSLLAEVNGEIKKISNADGPSHLAYNEVNTTHAETNQKTALWFSDYNNLLLLVFPAAEFDSEFFTTQQSKDIKLKKDIAYDDNEITFFVDSSIAINKLVVKDNHDSTILETPVTTIDGKFTVLANTFANLDLNKKYDVYVTDSVQNEYRLINKEYGQKSTVDRHFVVYKNLSQMPIYMYYTPTGRVSMTSFIEPVATRKIDDVISINKVDITDDALVFDEHVYGLGLYDTKNQVFTEFDKETQTISLENVIDARNEYIVFIQIEEHGEWHPVHANELGTTSKNFGVYDTDYVFVQPKSEFKLSSIVTFYNTEEYLMKTLTSLIPKNQGLGVSEYEVIMVNDGSLDNGAEIAQEFDDKYANFRLINQENKGLGGARNTGISEAQGTYMAFVDGDDFLPENAYRDMIDSAYETGSEVVTGEVLRYKNGKTSVSLAYRQSHITTRKAVTFKEVPELVHDTTAWNKLFKKDYFLKQGLLYPERLYEDMEISIKMLENANHIDILSRPVYYWLIRDTQGNASITNSREKISNFTDRMVGVHAIHDFLMDNEVLRLSYEKKVLEIDMPMYIKRFPVVDAEYQSEIIQEVRWILDEFLAGSLEMLSYTEKIQYSLLANEEVSYFNEFQQKLNDKKLNITVNSRGEISSDYNDVLYENRPKFTKADIVGTMNVSDIVLSEKDITVKIKNGLTLFNQTPDLNAVYVGTKEGKVLIKTDITDVVGEYVYVTFSKDELTKIEKTDALNLIVTIDDVTVSVLTTVQNNSILRGLNIYEDDQLYGLGKNKNNRLIGIVKDIHTVDDLYVLNGQLVIITSDSGTLVIQDENHNHVAMKREGNTHTIDVGILMSLSGNEFIVLNTANGKTFNFPKYYHSLDNHALFTSFDNEGNNTLVLSSKFIEVAHAQIIDGALQADLIVDDFDKQDLLITLRDDHKLIRSRGHILDRQSAHDAGREFVTISIPLFDDMIVNDDKLTIHVTTDTNHSIPLRVRDIMTPIMVQDSNIMISMNYAVNHAMGDLNIAKAPVLSEVTEEPLKSLSNFKNKGLLHAVDYSRNLVHEPIQENVIFYESFYGQLFTDNPFGVFKYVMDHDSEKYYKHVWVVKDDEQTVQRERFSEDADITFVKYDSEEYRYYLAVAKYIVMNTSTVLYFAPRQGQRVLQAWHGIPLKALGTDSNMTRGANRNVIRSFAEATHYLNPNVYTDKKVVDTLDLKDISNATRMIGSYPRWERVMNAIHEGYKKDILAKVINIDVQKKLVLYAPTWRGENGKVQDASRQFIENYHVIRQSLPDNYELIMKVHENAYTQMIKSYNVNEINFVPHYLDASEILSVTDLLISDYSSIIFDYAITGRPVIEYMYDLDEYAKVSGFYTEILTKLPGQIIKSEATLSSVLSSESFQNMTYNLGDLVKYDANSLDRMMSEFFSSEDNDEAEVGASVMAVRASQVRRRPEGLAAHINKLAENRTVALYHVDEYSKKDDEFFEQLNPNVRHFYRIGEPVIQPAEYIAIQKFVNEENLVSEDMTHLNNFIHREMRRVFGNIRIDDFKALYEVSKNDYALYTITNFK